MRNITTIKLPPMNPARVKRGHKPHRSGAGFHADRRTNRLRTRSQQRQFALREE